MESVVKMKKIIFSVLVLLMIVSLVTTVKAETATTIAIHELREDWESDTPILSKGERISLGNLINSPDPKLELEKRYDYYKQIYKVLGYNLDEVEGSPKKTISNEKNPEENTNPIKKATRAIARWFNGEGDWNGKNCGKAKALCPNGKTAVKQSQRNYNKHKYYCNDPECRQKIPISNVGVTLIAVSSQQLGYKCECECKFVC
jgi:hypothetical protein